MNTPDLDSIKKVVREVLQEMGLISRKAPLPVPRQGPRVLFIFHGGVRKLEIALEQVRLIEDSSAKSSIYTVTSARNRLCGGEVKDKAGTRCILDTVEAEALEKVIARADFLILPTFCLMTAARLAGLTCDDEGSGIVFSGLLQGKKILATRDGFLACDRLGNDKIQDEIQRILTKLENLGMVFCQTDQLNATFHQMMNNEKGKTVAGSETALAAPSLALITSKDVYAAVESKRNSIYLAAGGKVTPLARDLAKEYSIEILEV